MLDGRTWHSSKMDRMDEIDGINGMDGVDGRRIDE